MIAEFSIEIWKVEENGVVSPRAKILYPARVLEKRQNKDRHFQKNKNEDKYSPADLQRGNPMGERKQFQMEASRCRKGKPMKTGNVWVNLYEYWLHKIGTLMAQHI